MRSEQWIIDDLKSIGCDTARSVLNLSREESIRCTDLEEEMVDDIIKILRTEFENEGKK
jgi:N utilization substance protein A